MTFEEMSESVTGFDEIAVEKIMGMDMYTEAEAKPVLLLRSLVFIHIRRSGISDPDARKQVMEMPLGDVNDYFASKEEDVDPDEPDSESGKDESVPETEPSTSLTSVSAPESLPVSTPSSPA
jgi:hypothetical protein